MRQLSDIVKEAFLMWPRIQGGTFLTSECSHDVRLKGRAARVLLRVYSTCHVGGYYSVLSLSHGHTMERAVGG